jgi:hypothetical protein
MTLLVATAAFAIPPAPTPSTVYVYDNAGNITAVIDLATDLQNCGALGTVCVPVNEACCAGTCIDTRYDAANCGSCGTSCSIRTPACLNSKCGTCPLDMEPCRGVCVGIGQCPPAM